MLNWKLSQIKWVDINVSIHLANVSVSVYLVNTNLNKNLTLEIQEKMVSSTIWLWHYGG